jgi:two-component SAPR family response regulator
MRKKILVVDDDTDVLTWFRATQFRLENEFSYFFLDDHAKLLDSVLRIKPDLIIIDINLKQVSGPEFAEVLHFTSYHSIPVVYLSTESWYQAAPKNPGLNFLPKPLTQKKLDIKIKNVLNAA